MRFHETTYGQSGGDSFSFSAEAEPSYAVPDSQAQHSAQYPPQQQHHHHHHHHQQQSYQQYETQPQPPSYPPQQQPNYGYGGYQQQQHQQQGENDMTWGTQEFSKALNAAQAVGTMWGITGGRMDPFMGQGGPDGFKPPSMQDLTTWWGFFRMYFRVTNRYVLKKLKVIAFPFTKDHSRTLTETGGSSGYCYADASHDVNAMDLYIPSLALVTYVLLSAAIMGASKTFRPEVLGSQTSWCIVVCFLEMCVLQGLALSFGAKTKLWVLDSVCMSGYKFVGVCLCLLCRYLVPSPFWMVPMGWCCACSGFLLRAQLSEHFKEGSHVLVRAQPALLAVAVWQPFIYLFLIANVVGE